MTAFELGQRVTFAHPLFRRTDHGRYYDADFKPLPPSAVKPSHRFWEPNRWDKERREGVIVGKRTLQNGDYAPGSYDEFPSLYNRKFFEAYLVAEHLRKKPVLVLAEHIEAVPS